MARGVVEEIGEEKKWKRVEFVLHFRFNRETVKL
jgi:hypothetical protein